MKHLLILLFALITTVTSAQLNYIDLDWIIDQTQVMMDGQTNIQEIDINADGSNDMRITSWSNHQSGIATVVEVLMLDAVGFGGLQAAIGNQYIQNCPGTSFSYQSIDGYIYTSDSPNPYADQYVKFPFRFEGTAGPHCGFLYVRYVGTTITIEGYAWNPTPSGTCSCPTSGWLSLKEFEPNQNGEYELYNLMGQQVDNPEGLTLKVYENGLVEKIYCAQ